MPINKKKESFDCSKIRVIPQISDNTCWFNAMLMIALYSDKSRKLMKKISKKWDEKDSFFRIIKKIMFKLYKNPDKVIPFFKKIQPSLLLLKMFRKFKDKSIIEHLRDKLKKNIIAFSWSSNYIVKFYRYLGVKCVDITYNNKTKEVYLNIDKYVNYESNNETIKPLFNLDLFNKDVKNDNFGSEFKKGETPDVLILFHQDLNTRVFNRNLNFYNKIKTLASKDVVEKFSLSHYVKNQKGIGSVADVITLNGVEYELDAVILSNYNKVEQGNHAIAGITCGNEKFVYNGWVSNIIGKEPSPCSLMKLDWDIKKDTKFCLNSSLCKLNFITKENTKNWCFSFAKGPRSLIYVKKDKKEEMKTPLISTKAVISNVESIVKDVHLYDLDKYSKTEILGFIKNLGGINLDVSQQSSLNKLKEVYFNLVMNYMKKHALITPKDNKKGSNGKKDLKECPPDKVLNELTQRCVSRTSPLGLKILGLKGSIDKKKVPNGKKDLKECPPDKVLNELTQRCVSKTSPLGLKILANK